MNPILRNILAGMAGSIVSMPANMFLLAPLGRLTGAPVAPAFDPTAPPAATEAIWRAYFDSLEAVHMLGPLFPIGTGPFAVHWWQALSLQTEACSSPSLWPVLC